MGVLDDAIREHLDLKRRHGAAEEELRRQEEEALGPARREVAPAQTDEDATSVQAEAAQGEQEALPETHADDAALASGAEPTESPESGVEDAPLDEYAAEAEGEHPLGAPAGDEQPQLTEPTALHDEAGLDEPSHLEDAALREEPVREDTALDDEAGEYASAVDEPGHPEDATRHDANRDDRSDATVLYDVEESFDEDDDDSAESARFGDEAGVGDTPPRGFEALDDDELDDDGLDEDEEPGDADVLEDTPDFLQETPEHDRLWFEQKPPRDFDFD
jgi:hypothetical protein